MCVWVRLVISISYYNNMSCFYVRPATYSFGGGEWECGILFHPSTLTIHCHDIALSHYIK